MDPCWEFKLTVPLAAEWWSLSGEVSHHPRHQYVAPDPVDID